MGKLHGIAIRSAKRKPMQALTVASVSCEKGVDIDFRGKPSNRQVTVLDVDAWNDACVLLGESLDWKVRRSNLLVKGLTLYETTGQLIVIGDVVLKITQETDPCKRMEEAVEGLFDALNPQWRGGVCCRVVQGGEIKLNDDVMLMTAEQSVKYLK